MMKLWNITVIPCVFLALISVPLCNCTNSDSSLILERILDEKECQKVRSIEVRYNEFFELYFGHNHDTGELEENGIVYKSLVKAVNACCPETTLNFTKVTESVEVLVQNDVLLHHADDLSNSTHLTFYFPEFTKQGTLNVYSHNLPFLKLRKSPGFALVMLKSESHLNVSAADIIAPSWPIFALIISLSLAVGILVWALENFKNRDDFPRPFIRGLFSGFWWAFVTMSTVGYGDKTPKSYPGRVLAVLWILAGAILLSLFTANTTSIITTSRIEQNGETTGKKIGVVNMVEFVEAELNLGAHLQSYTSIKAALNALREKEIDRLLFPHYLDLLYLMSDTDLLEDGTLTDLYIAKVFDKPFQIGMVLSHGEAQGVRDNYFYTCIEIMTSRFARQYNYDYSNIKTDNHAADTFDTETTLHFIYGILGIIFAMVVIGLIFDVVRYSRKRKKDEIRTTGTGKTNQVV